MTRTLVATVQRFELTAAKPLKLDEPQAESKSKLVFMHKSPNLYPVLRPQSYKEIAKRRSPAYMKLREESELEYQQLLPSGGSYVYATLLGYHKMTDSKTYQGYTHYFTLSSGQLNRCIFEVISKDLSLAPSVGIKGLKECIKFWNANKSKMRSYTSSVGTTVKPRIEVLIPFSVKVDSYYPQKEDR